MKPQRARLAPKLPSEILDSYFRIAGKAGESLGECKLIVVGRGQAGKTSLIKRLRGQSYDPKEPETHGITIQQLEFDGATEPCDGPRVGLRRAGGAALDA